MFCFLHHVGERPAASRWADGGDGGGDGGGSGGGDGGGNGGGDGGAVDDPPGPREIADRCVPPPPRSSP